MELPSTAQKGEQGLLLDLHVKYIQALGKSSKTSLTAHLTSHLRLNAVYWGLTALHVMGRPDVLDRAEMIEFVRGCWDERVGAFSPHPGHDAHLLSTLSALQTLIMQDAMDEFFTPTASGDSTGPNIERIVSYILSLQTDQGCFMGDEWGEEDTRFLYCAVSGLSLLGRLDELDAPFVCTNRTPGAPPAPQSAPAADAPRPPAEGPTRKELTLGYISRCKNWDGGYGSVEGAESHAAQVWVCTAALAILGADGAGDDGLAHWLAERQLPCGGLNGRPEKKEDVCYSFWTCSALAILRRLHWIDAAALERFILSAQDAQDGGIADRPDNMVDVFHTLFGVAGLSLLGYPGLVDLDPVYCMPAPLIEKMGLRRGWKALPRRTA